MIEILDPSKCPKWLEYPKAYLSLIRENKDEFLPWYLYGAKDIQFRLEGLHQRYPKRKLFPFARRDDNDDIACWESESPGKVQIIHDFASEGWEQREVFDSFEAWYAFVLSERWKEDEQV